MAMSYQLHDNSEKDAVITLGKYGREALPLLEEIANKANKQIARIEAIDQIRILQEKGEAEMDKV